MRSSINSKFKQFFTSVAIALFRAIRSLKRGAQSIATLLFRPLSPIGRIILNITILPLYRAVVMLKIKFHRLALPTRGIALFFMSNRYLFHVVLGVASLATIFANVQTRQAQAQDVGQNSLLYALVTNSDYEIVQEVAREGEPPSTPVLNEEAIAALPHIDFDYDEETERIASFSIPGAISANTIPNREEESRAPRTKTETYIVEDGDTIASIAKKFSVNVGTVLWSNNLTERQYIKPGDALKIPPVSGVLVTIKKGDTVSKLAKNYDADEQEIKEFNKILDEATLALGTEIMIPGGHPPQPVQTLIAISGRSQESTAVRAGRNITKPPNVNTQLIPKGTFLWPTTGHVITQYYGWRHTGVDIDGDFSSPLYAAYDGVVEQAGWNSSGYGIQVLIKHTNGMVTRYGHASKLFVKIGDHVTRGQVIAMMGSTGRSTGSHLHFEVYANGRRTNPLGYIR
jgi:murein DD-endopeptidase MepM/ murein hydrolase activator NlpD